MKTLQRLLSILAVLALAACGGGGGSAGTSPLGPGASGGTGGTTTTPTVVPAAADLVFLLSASSVANSGAETVVATATAIDGNRNTVTGVPVTVSVNSNAVVTPAGTKTDDKGQLNATVGIGSDRSARDITVSAVSGGITKTAVLKVVATSGTATGAPSDLLLTLAAPTIPNNGSKTVVATATALDARRNVMPGVVVSISVDAGATAIPSGTTTAATGTGTGTVTAQIGIGSNATNRVITVTATTSGLPARTVSLQVVDTPTTINPTAADLSLALSAGTLVNGGTSTIVATATAVDANRNALAGIPMTLTVDNNAVITVSGSTTNSSGVVTGVVTIGADRSNRSIIVTASSGTVTKSASFSVIGAKLTASLSPKVDAASTGNQIEYRLLDANGTPMSAQPISVTALGLPSDSGLTDVNGKFTYTYTAPSAAGTLNIVASAAGNTNAQAVSVQAAGSTLPNATPVPQSASLTPTPSVVSVNVAGSTTNQVELRALFLGANNQPVSNVRVRFSVDPANSSDGTAAQLGGSIYAYSDAAGVARGTFTPGVRSSPTNGVTVQACWDVSDFVITAPCPANRLITNTLTIASEALSVNIRTNNLIKSGAANLTYIKEFVVMVVDAAGQAKADVLITPSVDLPAFYKGYYVVSGASWVQVPTLAATENWSWDTVNLRWVAGAATTSPMCPNDDVNRNGVREAGTVIAGAAPPAVTLRQEDLNWNGFIDPRKSDVAVKMVGSSRTDANGLAIVQIEYGQNLASWVDFVITVTASGIAGTEARALYTGLLYGLGNLPYPAAAIADPKVAPAFVVSPYGRGTVCTDDK